MHRVVFLIYAGVAAFDVAGPSQAFAVAGKGVYEVILASVSGGLIESDCPGVSFDSVPVAQITGQIDTLVLAGGLEAPEAARRTLLVDETRRLASLAKRVACVCTGAFIAAEAGLLTGRRAVTHWRYCDDFAAKFPDVHLERDSIWVRDGNIWTSAGVSAGVDLALALVEHDRGINVALSAARELVVYLKRSGGQSQFSTVLSGQMADADGRLGPLLEWITDNLAEDLRADVLAERVGMSPRSFARAFRARTGMTPAKAVEMIRLQTARDAIETGTTPLGVIAQRHGFGDEQRMRRAFLRQFNATPKDLRAHFSGHFTPGQEDSIRARVAGKAMAVSER